MSYQIPDWIDEAVRQKLRGESLDYEELLRRTEREIWDAWSCFSIISPRECSQRLAELFIGLRTLLYETPGAQAYSLRAVKEGDESYGIYDGGRRLYDMVRAEDPPHPWELRDALTGEVLDRHSYRHDLLEKWNADIYSMQTCGEEA